MNSEQMINLFGDLHRAAARASMLTLAQVPICIFHTERTDYVVGLNDSSVQLIEALLSNNEAHAFLRDYASRLDIPIEIAQEFVTIQHQEWASLDGLFDTKIAYPKRSPHGNPFFNYVIHIGGKPVHLAIYSEKVAEFWDPFTAGIRSDAPISPAQITCFETRSGIQIQLDDGAVYMAEDALTARGELVTAVCDKAFPELQMNPKVHGATLRHPNGKNILITGDSGQGKTTLTLGMVALGMELLADDFSIFDSVSETLFPAMLNPSIKSGAFDVLEPYFPSLANAPVVQQGDRLCKYLPRQNRPAPWDAGHSVDLVLFPQWAPNAKPSLVDYDRVQAVVSLLQYSHLPQNAQNLQRFLDFITREPIYQLNYSDFEGAKSLIDQALEN